MERKERITPINELLPRVDITAYDHIQLTPEEELRALRFAKATKAKFLEEQEDLRMRQEAYKKALEPWTQAELRRYVADKAEKLPFRFVIDEHNHHVFELLVMYFSNDPRFETYGATNDKGEIIQQYSLQKGICLHSKERGTGKTLLMDLFAHNKRCCHVVVPTAKISSFFQADGDEVIKRFNKPWAAEKVAIYFYQSPIGVCFDDFGDEAIKIHYGNKENVMGRIITSIYAESTDKTAFKYFHATTNLNGPEIEEKYDTRVRSRMREMFNWINLPGKDRRR